MLLVNFLTAQVTVSGNVSISSGDQTQGIPFWEVAFFMTPDAIDPDAVALTDDDGNYAITVETTFAGTPPWSVRTLDMCTGEMQVIDIMPDADQSEYTGLNFMLCEDFNPPPPEDCQAYFHYEQATEEENYEVSFFDISTPASGVTSWAWDLGDGTTSTEQNPVHTYAEAGEYVVSLEITVVLEDGEECSSSTEQLIFVWDNNDCFCPPFEAEVCVLTPSGDTLTYTNHCYAECAGYGPDTWVDCEVDSGCDCPEDVYDPVCVTLPIGTVIEFVNACEAECAGFQAGDYQPCDGECVCPEFYDPVCVTLDNGDVLTFDNFCFAQCAGYGPEQWMLCDDIGGCDCPDVYDPVCVMIDDTPFGIISFPNACEAECLGYTAEDFVDCNEGGCECTEEYDPVCVEIEGGVIVPFPNACYAECAGYEADDLVDCEDNCICLGEWDPVCVEVEEGIVIPFANACEAECEGYTAEDFVECEQGGCECDDEYDPVCVMIDDSPFGTITYPNACYAECDGYTAEDFVDCEQGNECECDGEFAPVCVEVEGGIIIPYPNACFAECEGYTAEDFVDCDFGSGCECDDEYDPVCVMVGEGPFGVVTYPNACYAECDGYTAEDFVDCEQGGGCDCYDEEYAPVCVEIEEGIVIPFVNACEAECFGYTAEDFVECEQGNECECSYEWDPVCVATEGAIVTYPNACLAECEGYTEDDFVDCVSDCECEDFYLPVCVIDQETGETLEFMNPCEALCEGYGPEAIVPCEPVNECWVYFDFEVSGEEGLTLEFNAQVMNADTITSWAWDFGDGTTSTEANPTHTYAEAGVYDITLVVTTNECGEITTLQHICIGEGGGVVGPECQSFFFFEQPNEDDLTTIQFVDLSVGDINAWAWDFGDGTTSTEQNPSHTYETAGDYIVTLTIFADDCESTMSMPVLAGENIWYGDLECRAWFLPLMTSGNEVFFENLSSSDAVEFSWDFGDGQTSNEPIVLHEYAEAGIYTVTLTIITDTGCENSFSMDINIETSGLVANPTFAIISSVDEADQAVQALSAAPNPTNGLVRMNWETAQDGAYQWQLFDLNGRMIRSGSAQAQSLGLELDLSDQPSGIYLFRLQTKQGVQTLKVNKM